MQRPSSVSAIKVEGRRSHDRVRAGEEVELAERPVVVGVFDVLDVRPEPELGALDVDVVVTCSSGTYVRALARDLGEALGVGGHLTALRRTRVGCFGLAAARTLEQLAEDGLDVLDMGTVARAAFPAVTLTAADANAVRYGRTIELGMAWARASHPEFLEPSVARLAPRSPRGCPPEHAGLVRPQRRRRTPFSAWTGSSSPWPAPARTTPPSTWLSSPSRRRPSAPGRRSTLPSGACRSLDINSGWSCCKNGISLPN